MKINENNVDEYVSLLTDLPEYVDKLSDEEIDFLIKYLENEINRKENILNELKNNVES